MDEKPGFLFLGNQLTLDLSNCFPIFGALLRWFQAAKLLSPSEAANLQRRWGKSARAQETLTAIRELREDLRWQVLLWERGLVGSYHHPGKTIVSMRIGH